MIIDREQKNRPEILEIDGMEEKDGYSKDSNGKAQPDMEKPQHYKGHKAENSKNASLLIFLYESQCWTIRKADEDNIDTFEMYCCRRMLRISWVQKRTNASILQQLGVKERLSTVIRRRILHYFGHIVRQDNLEKRQSKAT